MQKKFEHKMASTSNSHNINTDTTFLHLFDKMSVHKFEITSVFHYKNHAKLIWNESVWLQAWQAQRKNSTPSR